MDMDIVIASGTNMYAMRAGPAGAQGAVSSALQEMSELGIEIGTVGLTGGNRSPLPRICGNQFGEGNDMYAQTHNLAYPYRPNYRQGDICRHDPNGKILWVDHVGPGWTIQNLPRADIFSDREFNILKGQFDDAIAW